jgi:hypothetical protein
VGEEAPHAMFPGAPRSNCWNCFKIKLLESLARCELMSSAYMTSEDLSSAGSRCEVMSSADSRVREVFSSASAHITSAT